MYYNNYYNNLLTIRIPILFISALVLNACSYINGQDGILSNREYEYQEVEQQVQKSNQKEPSYITHQFIQDPLYPVPDIKLNPKQSYFIPSKENKAPRANSLLEANFEKGLSVHRQNNQSWLSSTQYDSDELIAKLIKYLTDNGFNVTKQASNQLTTDWLLIGNDEDDKDFFDFSKVNEIYHKVRIELEPKSADQYLIHLQLLEAKGQQIPDKTNWQQAKQSGDLINHQLVKMMDYLAQEDTEYSLSVMSGNLDNLPDYSLTRDGNDYPVLVIFNNQAEAWFKIADAIEQSSLKLKDLNREASVFYLVSPFKQAEKSESDEELTEQLIEIKLSSLQTGIQIDIQINDESLISIQQADYIIKQLTPYL